MRDEDDLRAGLAELADGYEVPPGLADRVTKELAERRRLRQRTMWASAAAVTVAAMLLASQLVGGEGGDHLSTNGTMPDRSTTTAAVEQTTTTEAAPDTTTSTAAATSTTTTAPVTTTTTAPVTTTAPPVDTDPCDLTRVHAIGKADVDGDGVADDLFTGYQDAEGIVYPDYVDGTEALVGACLSAHGVGSTTQLGGILENVDIVDLDGDGRSEILAGASTALSSFQQVVAEHGGQVVPVLLGNEPFLLTRSASGTGAQPDAAVTFGCVDRDGDGRREVVHVTAQADQDAVRWTATPYRIRSAVAQAGTPWSGSAPAGSNPVTVADAIVPACS